MSDGYGVKNSSCYDDHATAWFVGVIAAIALLFLGWLVYSANNPPEVELEPDQVRCMIANPGKDCNQITRWEPEAS